MALRFRSELDDTPFASGLRKMEQDAASSSAKIEGAFSGIASGRFAGAAAALGPGGAIVTGLGAIAFAGDEVANSLARINASTGNLEQTRAVYEQLLNVSRETGVAIGESAGMFTRYSIAARDIGATSDEVVRLIELVQKAGVVGGSSATEISSAAMQLGQALASGRFQGDELRSILENMPLLAEGLAKQLGVGVGELREMGKEGKLTTDVVFPALLAAAEEVNSKFGEMPMTMSRAWAGFKVDAKSSLSILDEILNVSGRIKQTIEGWRGFAPGDRNELETIKAIQKVAEEDIKALTDRKTPLLPKPAYVPTEKEIKEEKKADAERDRINKDLDDRSEKYAKEEEDRAQRIGDAYDKMLVNRLDKQEQLRMKAAEAFEESIRNAEKEREKNSLERQLKDAEKVQEFENDLLQDAEEDLSKFNRSSADERRQMNRDARDEEHAKAREKRMRLGDAKDARAGAGERERARDNAQNRVGFAQGEIDRLATAIENLQWK